MVAAKPDPLTVGLCIDPPVPDRRPESGSYAASRAKMLRLRNRLFREEAERAMRRMRRAGVNLRCDGDKLMAGPEAKLLPWVRGLIGRYKAELVKLLTAESGSGDSRPRRSGMRRVEPQNAADPGQPHGRGQITAAAGGAVGGEPGRGSSGGAGCAGHGPPCGNLRHRQGAKYDRPTDATCSR